jgi:type II secretory pathway pseudopilin PulG
METRKSESGFTLVELMLASTITLVVMGVAFSTFKDALALNETVIQVTDASQNLRAGTNLLIRDLLQAGRNIPTGGIAIPSGPKAKAISRPGPPGTGYFFDNDDADATTLTAITTGAGLGPKISGKRTDLVTILMGDPYLEPLSVYPSNVIGDLPRLAADGSSFDLGSDTKWLGGDPANAVPPIAEGDLIYFSNSKGTTLQTVTDVTDSVVSFEADDPFNLNQRNAGVGSITELLPKPCADPPAECYEGVGIRRVLMFTYYVHEETPGVPRLMRQVNHGEPQALAGVVETLDLSYDLVGGTQNPTNLKSLPQAATVGGVSVTYSANQVRKVNLRVGVRTEFISPRTKDYLRNHVSTVISLRNLAYVDRYDTDPAEDE